MQMKGLIFNMTELPTGKTIKCLQLKNQNSFLWTPKLLNHTYMHMCGCILNREISLFFLLYHLPFSFHLLFNGICKYAIRRI